jgi:protein-disulfide isomerase
MKSTSRPVKKKRTGLSSIPATYWLIGIVAVMVALALIVLVGMPAAATERAKATGNTLGDANAPVTVEVYADFQCPICGQFDRGTLKQIREHRQGEDRVRSLCIYRRGIDSRGRGQ